MTSQLRQIISKLRRGLDWRLRGWLGDELVDLPKIVAARWWRPLLKRTRFIGITGSAGKTTTKDILLTILSSKHSVIGTAETFNVPAEVARLLLKTRPRHAFCVTEVSAGKPGSLDVPIALLKPDISIATVVEDDHLSAYGSREGIAEEKSKLVAALPSNGVAVLNADDDLVLGMASKTKARVITFGRSPQANLRALEVHSAWPTRLSVALEYQGQRTTLQTQLCGSHMVTPLLAAVAGSLAAGLTLEECALGAAKAKAHEGRMQPVETTAGVTFIRDDFKSPLWTIDSCFDFLRNAKAQRKIMVIGTLSDGGPTSATTMYKRVARQAQEVADLTIFVGPWASHALQARRPGNEDSLKFFSRVSDATAFIHANTRNGDLVLLKGTNKQDHLVRIPLSFSGEIQCWKENCKRFEFCTNCSERMKPSAANSTQNAATVADDPREQSQFPGLNLAPTDTVIVGLGNPEPERRGTPHNIGYEVVDSIATALGAQWKTFDAAWVATGTWQGRGICLLKMRVPMNHIGPALEKASEALGFAPAQCILVYDDLDSPMGLARSRLRGGAAGHRGVSSILESFQTAEIRRIKIGVKPERAIENRAAFVLGALSPTEQETLMNGVPSARKLALELASRKPAAEAAPA